MKLFFKRLFAYLPHKLPQGMAEFDTWATDIIQTYQMPDNDSIRFALAVAILHLPQTAAYRSKAFFGHVLIKGAASQIAGAVMQDLKLKQQAEATATPKSDVADGQTPQASN